MNAQERYLDEMRWTEALRAAQAGDTARLEFMLRTSDQVPEAVRLWLADRVRLLGRQGPGRRSILPPALLMMERSRYEHSRKKKVFALEAAERYGVDPETMRHLLKPKRVREK